MATPEPDTDELIARAQGGDSRAREKLLVRHRDRLKQMVALRLDRRLAKRVDSSDVVQEALTDAAEKLSAYLEKPPLPFYPWLRRLAWERIVKLHEHHLAAAKRDVRREEPWLSHESALALAKRIMPHGTSPSQRAARAEMHGRVQAALAQLRERDREVLVLRYLEQLTTRESAAVLGITENAVKVRHLRALERLRGQLKEFFDMHDR